MSLSHGPSRIIFSEFACIPDNVVLLTSRGEEGTLGRALFDLWNGQQRDDDKWEKGRLGRNVMLDEVRTLTVRTLSCNREMQHVSIERLDEIQSAAAGPRA